MANRIASTFNQNFFSPTGSGGFKIAGTDILKDIKNSRPNWHRGQFSNKILPQLL